MNKCRLALAELAVISAADQKMQRAARMRLAEVASVAGATAYAVGGANRYDRFSTAMLCGTRLCGAP
jgi:hypothetical protein